MTKINPCCNMYYAASKSALLGLSCQPMGLMLKNYIYQKRKAMKKNMGNIDRIVRVVIAAIFVVLFFTNVVSGVLGFVLLGLAGVFVLTSLVSFCPLYTLVGLSTCPLEKK